MSFCGGNGWQNKLDFWLCSFQNLAFWMTRREPWQAWAIVVGSILAITALDLSPAGEAANIRTLYVLPVTLACWMLKPKQALAVTGTVIIVLFVKPQLHFEQPDFLPLIATATARTVAYATVAAFLLSFRRVYDDALASARRDPMTGVRNKTAFEDEAAAMVASCRLTRETLLLATIDLDGFKQVNDRHGHATGDIVLKTFSLGLMSEIRRTDRVGRIGGDEFALLLRAESTDDARRLAAQVHDRAKTVLAATGHAVTGSMGALIVPSAQALTYAELMREADRLMYAAKRGKNGLRVSIAGEFMREDNACAAVNWVARAASAA